MITLVCFTDGRDHIYGTIPSALAHLQGPIGRRLIYDDSGDARNRARLADAFPTFTIAHHPEGRQGFGGAIRFMWSYLVAEDANPYVFHLEDDFLFNCDVDLAAMIAALELYPDLAQIALRRQPWNQEERDAGGVVELHPDSYYEQRVGDDWLLMHNQFFTTNPCLYRRSLCRLGWPADPHSEGRFGAILRSQLMPMCSAFWGPRSDDPWVEHIGRERVGTGY